MGRKKKEIRLKEPVRNWSVIISHSDCSQEGSGIQRGGKLGRKVGSVKTAEQMKAEYREVISLLRKGYSIRDVAKLCGKGVSTLQRVKRLLKVQSSQ